MNQTLLLQTAGLFCSSQKLIHVHNIRDLEVHSRQTANVNLCDVTKFSLQLSFTVKKLVVSR